MKYIVPILAFLVFFFVSFSMADAQILDSTYVRGGEVESEVDGDVLGVLGEEIEEEIVEEEGSCCFMNRVVEIMAVMGGLILVALFTYIVYEKR